MWSLGGWQPSLLSAQNSATPPLSGPQGPHFCVEVCRESEVIGEGFPVAGARWGDRQVLKDD